MLLVVLYPFLYNVVIAFSNMSLGHLRDASFIGFDHFRTIFTEPEILRIFLKTVVWTGVNVIAHLTLGIGLAILLNQEIRGRAWFRALLILPWAMPQYITALTWKGMFNYEFGAVNLILRNLHLPPVPWLSNAYWAFAAPIIANIWLGFPFMMVIALGGLQSIPRELYEAADIDGAGWWFRLRRITLPLLKPVLVPAAVLGTIWTFNNLNVIWLVTNQGEPADKTHILVTYVYKAAFHYYRYGYAAAFSLVIFLILLAFVVYFLRVTREKEGAA
ncbi:MAG: sugar ABC transporter permease [Candidatus Eisenbacteria bacterium]|nr:sugar ABC transporter permease [Candidatus Eisenbacteria bacterium]